MTGFTKRNDPTFHVTERALWGGGGGGGGGGGEYWVIIKHAGCVCTQQRQRLLCLWHVHTAAWSVPNSCVNDYYLISFAGFDKKLVEVQGVVIFWGRKKEVYSYTPATCIRAPIQYTR